LKVELQLREKCFEVRANLEFFVLVVSEIATSLHWPVATPREKYSKIRADLEFFVPVLSEVATSLHWVVATGVATKREML
jgi:hypothetical protein